MRRRRVRVPWWRRLAGRGEGGYAAVLVAVVVSTVGLACAAVGVDTANWYVEVQKVQKTADAAALAGVPFLPQDLASARDRALEIAADNGYDNNGTTNTVTVGPGPRSTQLKVTIVSRVSNQFGAMIGSPGTRITQSAIADYQGPAPMGSPCNTFGNEPNPGNVGGTNSGSARPLGTAQSSGMSAYCSRAPQFWATVEGPGTGKVQGDRYQTLDCEDSGVDGCSGTTNDEYDPFGYTFLVRVGKEAVNTPVKLQLYDPMFVNTGSDCSLLPSRTVFAVVATLLNVSFNGYVTWADAAQRYTDDAPATSTFGSSDSYCTGDSYPGDGSGKTIPDALTTSFVLRQQDDSQNPGAAAVQTDTAGRACISQYGAYSTVRTRTRTGFTAFPQIDPALLTLNATGFNDDVAASLHNWMDFCTFTPTRAGDYYLQVRTNVSLGGTPRSLAGRIRTGNPAAAAAAANTTAGEGSNSFAIRAVTNAGYEPYVSVSGYEHMPIYINADAATATFHLIRVLPGAAGQKISFSYFDAGDAQGAGSVSVQVPDDATTAAGTLLKNASTTVRFPGGCTSYGGSASGSQTSQVTLTDCSAPITKVTNSTTSRNNGKVQTITIPIPTDYRCTENAYSGCWYRVKVTFGSGTSGSSVTDVTTWDATVIGDPVRLVQ